MNGTMPSFEKRKNNVGNTRKAYKSVVPWKKYANNKFEAFDGKKFPTDEMRKAYNKIAAKDLK